MYTATLLRAAALVAAAHAVSFTIQSTNGNATSPYAYGIMFEDINNAGDGGVYAELVQNRAFQGSSVYPSTLDFYSEIGGAELALSNLTTPLSAALPTSMQVSCGNSSTGGTIGFSNAGFWGFPIVAGWQYNGSFYVYGSFNGTITASLQSLTDQTYASASINAASVSGAWTQFNYTLHPTEDAPNANNTLNFVWDSSDMATALDFNLISLFPPTYDNAPNGFRPDLIEALAGLQPSFFRLPGGNNIEGLQSPFWWNWTQTIGPVIDRPGYPGTWGYEQTNGLGLLEYMIWAEDILNTTPVFAVWDGLWLDNTTVPQDQLGTYVQAALDELEFLTGDVSTTWGAKRAEYGHPEPFTIKFVEVGNEDSLSVAGMSTYPTYRFNAFYDAIHSAYPDVTIIASYYDVDGATPPFNGTAGDIHNYEIPSTMSKQFTLFDNYTSEHPILLGEYAIVEYDTPVGLEWTSGAPRAFFPFWYGSVAEAIYLLGSERNSDKVIGASYAPTFQNLNRWEWVPNMISFDAFPGDLVLSTSYHVISFLSSVRITENLPMTLSADTDFGPAFWVAGRSNVTGAHILKATVYNSSANVPFSVTFDGVYGGTVANLTYLTAPMNASNTIGNNVVQTTTQTVKANRAGQFNFELPDYSVAIMEISGDAAGYANPGRRQGWKGFKTWGGGW